MMDIKEAIKERRSIRRYKDMPIEPAKRKALEELILQYNRESGLNIQLIEIDANPHLRWGERNEQ